MAQDATPRIPNTQTDPELPSICSICRESPVNAVQLDCGHIFCYLCIKSVAESVGCCALCRREIGIEFNFREHNILGAARTPQGNNGYYWFYEGYRGWWLYDADTTAEIEAAYQRGDPALEKFIAGCIYVIDLKDMIQQRKDGDGKARKIIRSTLDLENILGMSGLKGQDFAGLLEMMRDEPILSALRP